MLHNEWSVLQHCLNNFDQTWSRNLLPTEVKAFKDNKVEF